MTKRLKTIWVLFAVSLVSCLLFVSVSFGQEMPKPGEVIDKNNYKKYAHLLPEEMLAGFENGWGGLFEPISIKVSETKPSPIPKVYQVFSEKNRGKFTLDNNGMIIGGYNYEGLPFPGVTPSDKDFATKLMWNFEYRYIYDDQTLDQTAFTKRRGEPIATVQTHTLWIYFVNRMVDPPKPTYKTPNNLLKSMYFLYTYPDILKNQIILTYRYLDPTKPDDIYIYLPSMRRVLRGEAGQRSTPMAGSLMGLDDFHSFDGRTQEFTYEFVGERKTLGISENNINVKQIALRGKKAVMPWPSENWEIKNVYVIDIKSKDPKYPQSKKRIYMDKENPANLYHAIVWDRAGNPWKYYGSCSSKFPMPDGDATYEQDIVFAIDMQFGMGFITNQPMKINNNGHKYSDFTPSAMLIRGR